MYRSVWKKYHHCVCSFEFYSRMGIRFYRATGFRYEDLIVTDICMEELRRTERVSLRFCPDYRSDPVTLMEMTVEDLLKCVAGEVRNAYSGIMVIRLPAGNISPITPVSAGVQSVPATGTPVAVIGFSRRMDRPCLKTGIVSSYSRIGGDDYLHIEAPIEPGTAGSPLIDALNGRLAGVVTDCVSSQLRDYRFLKQIIQENLRKLGLSKGTNQNEDLDMAQAMEANQHMIRHLARELYLRLQRNYGFAIPVVHLNRYTKAVEKGGQVTVRNPGQKG